MNKWTHVVAALLCALTAGYAASSFSSFTSLINPDADFSSITKAVNGVAVAALASGLTAVLGLSARVLRWVTLAALVGVLGTTAVSEVTVLTKMGRADRGWRSVRERCVSTSD